LSVHLVQLHCLLLLESFLLTEVGDT